WIAKHPRLHVLYVPARGLTEGSVSAWTYDNDGKVTKIATGHTNGLGAVHCEVSGDGKTLAVPNINGANLAVFAVNPSGTFANDPTAMFTFPFYVVGPNVKQQSASRPHQARFDGSSRFMYVPNLGTDRMHVFKVLGAGNLQQLDDVVLPSGSGPRHLAFWPLVGPSKYLYLVNQLSNTVMVFNISTKAQGAAPKLLQEISTRGAGLPRSDPNSDINAAEVVVSPDGGKNPRDHAIDPTGRYIAVTNQDTGITVVERNVKTGEFKGVVANYTTGSPVAVLWRPKN
ncbi:hypothetical protein FRC09_018696, partial [Ceratobasidium sp. 395]